MMRQAPFFLLLLSLEFARAFQGVFHFAPKRLPSSTISTALFETTAAFRNNLIELQKEGVSLLGCDADAVHTMSAGLWGTMADISENDAASKVCLILDDIPLTALESFASDFNVLKTQERLMSHLPELERISVSMVGDGPGVIMETTARTSEELAEKQSRTKETYDETKCTAALKSFIERIVINESACPYTKSVDIAATGLEAKGITPGPVGYRFNDSSDAARALAVFWGCVTELLSTPESEISTTMLSLPAIGAGVGDQAHKRFAAVMELVSRYLCLYRGDSSFGLVHFHPSYDRDAIHPIDRPSYGHLPPRSWLRAMMIRNGNTEEAESLTEEDLELSDHQRKAPFTAINILRVNQLNAASGPKSIVDLEVADGVFEKASGIPLYSRNAIRLAAIGKETLEAGLLDDIAVFQSDGKVEPEETTIAPKDGEDEPTDTTVATPKPQEEETITINRTEYAELLSEVASLATSVKALELKLQRLSSAKD